MTLRKGRARECGARAWPGRLRTNMAWNPLATQFCLELAFGVLLGLCFLPRAPLGTFFFLMMGATALLPLLVGGLAPPIYAGAPWDAPATVCVLAGALGFPWLMGPVKSQLRRLATIWATLGCGAALVFVVRDVPGVDSTGALVLGGLSAMATGLVAGSVGLAMVLGHWYLTVPQLPVAWLSRINRLTIWSMIFSSVMLCASCWVSAGDFEQMDRPLFGAWGLFFLGTRVATGLALPLLFAWMTAGSLRYGNTRSATGILYASTVLVLIGTAVSISLQDSYGIPL